MCVVGLSASSTPPRLADLASVDPMVRDRIDEAWLAASENLESSAPWFVLAQIYHAHDLTELAEECYLRTTELAPEEPKAWYLQALAQSDLGVDVLVVNRDARVYLLMNQVPDRGNWLRAKVVNEWGSPAMGGYVVARSGDLQLRREVHTAYSYQAANDPTVHFGLGDVERVDELMVQWPDGWQRCFGPQSVNQTLEVERSDGDQCSTGMNSPDTVSNPSRK